MSTNRTYLCPHCGVALQHFKTARGVVWSCDKCKGRAIAFAPLRGQVERNFANRLWQEVLEADRAGRTAHRPCPACKRAMASVPVKGVSEDLHLDACRICQFVWFDMDEMLHLPVLPMAPKEELDPRAREAIAMAKVEALAKRAQMEDASRGSRRAGRYASDWTDIVSTIWSALD